MKLKLNTNRMYLIMMNQDKIRTQHSTLTVIGKLHKYLIQDLLKQKMTLVTL